MTMDIFEQLSKLTSSKLTGGLTESRPAQTATLNARDFSKLEEVMW